MDFKEELSFWSLKAEELLQRLNTSKEGLSQAEAQARLKQFGRNTFKIAKKTTDLILLLAQFKSPLIFLLLFAAILSLLFAEKTDALIILVIVFASGLLGFFQERKAASAMNALLSLVQIKAMVCREGKCSEISVEEVVPGDILELNAGDIIPGDSLILESKDFFVDEASLTGETFGVEKREAQLPIDTSLSQRTSALFMGTHVISGWAKAVVVYTGRATEMGKLAEKLGTRAPETAFERGVRQFGYFLLEVTLFLTIVIFTFNIYLHRPILNSFLFSLALAVGMTPQLLPAIISVNLSHGARRMAKKHAIVKKLSSIENFGAMTVLCADKTGTLTRGSVELESSVDTLGKKSEKVHLYGYLNAFFQTGYTNPIDAALLKRAPENISKWKKLDEIPYDFVRKKISILTSYEGKTWLIAKGSFPHLLSVCTKAETSEGEYRDVSLMREGLQQLFENYTQRGLRVLGVAYRLLDSHTIISKEDEKDMIFAGFLLFFDPPKEEIFETIEKLKKLGIALKIITGDHSLVAAHLAESIGINGKKVICGRELLTMSDQALMRQVLSKHVFAEVEPNQKERIILALKKTGAVVGFLGDGINDVTALHTADVGISVDSAADVAKEAADLVLLEKNLSVIVEGVQEGRRTFANTLKYIFMATSANFGNMFSMAGASLFLPFLPLLPKQILLTNLFTDFPEMAIAADQVDSEWISKPLNWDIKFIRKFMIVFGLVSSIFDYLTFGILLFYLHSSVEEFRTGWFLESVISASIIILVIRTRKPFYQSKPSNYLSYAVFGVVLATLLLPFTPLRFLFNFTHLPISFYLMIGGIVALYICCAEFAKKIFYKTFKIQPKKAKI